MTTVFCQKSHLDYKSKDFWHLAAWLRLFQFCFHLAEESLVSSNI